MKYFLFAFCWLGAMSAAAAVIDLRVAPGVLMAETDLLAVLEVRVKEAADAGFSPRKIAKRNLVLTGWRGAPWLWD